MPDEWVKKIGDMLEDSLGSVEQKRTAYRAAVEMDAILNDARGGWMEYARRLFELWVHNMRYLMVAPSIDHNLDDTRLRSDADIASDYGLTTKAAIAAKQEQISAARETRIRRTVEHLNAGWGEAAISFCAGKDEWRDANRKANVKHNATPAHGWSVYQGGGE